MTGIEASRIFIDEWSARVLAATMFTARTPNEISRLFGIPVAICHSKAIDLERRGLLKRVRTVLTMDGREHRFYHCALSDPYIFLEGGVLRARFRLSDKKQEVYTMEAVSYTVNQE